MAKTRRNECGMDRDNYGQQRDSGAGVCVVTMQYSDTNDSVAGMHRAATGHLLPRRLAALSEVLPCSPG